jgi:hypothetical protein
MRLFGPKKRVKDLNRQGTLNPQPEAVIDEHFTGKAGFFDACDIAQVKYEMLRRVASGNSIAETLRAFGFPSRQSFYRARAAFEQRGLAGLIPAKRNSKGDAQLRTKSRRGADSKPKLNRTSFEQNLARIQEELNGSGTPLASVFVSDYLEIDFVMRKVRAGEKNIRLTPKEFDLLLYLVSQAGKPISHTQLLRAVWGPGFVDQIEYLRVFITYLRKKIEPDPSKPRYILTEPWVGYRFQAPDE